MKKTILLLFFILFFSFPFWVVAQEANEQSTCLSAERCDSGCASVNQSLRNAHTALLSLPEGVSLPPNSDTYIIECLGTPGGQICTTGNSALDEEIYKKDNVLLLSQGCSYKTADKCAARCNESCIQKTPSCYQCGDEDKHDVDYTFHYMKTPTGGSLTNPVKSKADGTLDPFIWHDDTPDSMGRQFLALNYTQPTAETGSSGGLQQGTFDWVSAAEDCVTIKWDPYGRVFDSQSLEPIMNAKVTLSMKRSTGDFTQVETGDIVLGNIINPQTVSEDGMFSFVVPDGTYKLGVVKPGYTFPVTDLSQIHPNYSKIYSDIYPAQTGEEIIQAGAIQHRDIPIEATGAVVETAPAMMEYFYKANPLTKKVRVWGRVSHPSTKMIFYSVKSSETEPVVLTRYRQLKQAQTDKMGNFDIMIDQSDFEPVENFGEVDLIKTDLRTLVQEKWYQKIISFVGGFVRQVEAQGLKSTTVKFTPIPTYLEGYAYDGSGKVVPGATVSLYLAYSNKPYYETKADETGYFKITTEHMPREVYKINYTAINGVVTKTTTTDFISKNKKYLVDNKINLNVYKNEKGKILTSKDLPKTTITTKPDGFLQKTGIGATKETSNPKDTTTGNKMMLVFGIMLFLIMVVLTILGVYLMKKKQSGQSLPPTL